MFIEEKKRSLAKSLSWRLTGTLITGLLVFILTHELFFALTAGILDLFIKLAAYFLHERIWNKIKFGRKEITPSVIWFTGLSGAGKTTIAESVVKQLTKKGLKVELIDGDSVRQIFPNTGFSREDRDQHIRRVGHLASQLEKHGVFVVVSLISPYEESRNFVKNLCRNFLEVHISTPLEICEKRDVKGLYAKARLGHIKNFTGVDDPYEAPLTPDITLDTTHISVDSAANIVINKVKDGSAFL